MVVIIHTSMWMLLLISSWSHSLYSTRYNYCIVATYINDVRSSHLVSIQTGRESRLIWDWSAVIHTVSASSSSLYGWNGKRPRIIYTCSRVSVHYYEKLYDTCRGTNVWPLIGSNSPKTVDWLKARQSRQNRVYLAFSSQKQVRCDAGQSHGSWRVICTWF